MQSLDARAARLWAAPALDALRRGARGDRRAQRLPGPGRRHRHEHVPDARGRRARPPPTCPSGAPVRPGGRGVRPRRRCSALAATPASSARSCCAAGPTRSPGTSGLDAATAVEGFRRADEQACGRGRRRRSRARSCRSAGPPPTRPPRRRARLDGRRRGGRRGGPRRPSSRTPDQLAGAGRGPAWSTPAAAATSCVLDTLARPGRRRLPAPAPPGRRRAPNGAARRRPRGLPDEEAAGSAGPAFEVMYLLDARRTTPSPACGRALWRLGRLPGRRRRRRALERPRPRRRRRRGGRGGHRRRAPAPASGSRTCRRRSSAGAPAGRPGRRRAGTRRRAASGLVAVAAGPGLATLFRGAGAVAVPGGPGERPSTGEILAAIRETGAALRSPSCRTTPTPSPSPQAARRGRAVRGRAGHRAARPAPQVQGLAAAAVHDPGRAVRRRRRRDVGRGRRRPGRRGHRRRARRR